MNFYIWRKPGFYSDGILIYVDKSLDNVLVRLKENEEYWVCVQTSYRCQEFISGLIAYSLENINKLSGLIEKERKHVLNKYKNSKECISFHKSATDLQIFEMYKIQFSLTFQKEFIDLNLVNKKSKWFLEPEVMDAKDPFFKAASD